MEICDSMDSRQPGDRTWTGNAKTAVAESAGRLEVAGKKFHLIGAGGAGMSALAKMLIDNSAIVIGSDQEASEVTNMLRQSGADIRIGHDADNLAPATNAVVVSAAITDDNPELKLARQRGCKVYKYAQMLGALMNGYEGVAISGTHGKSTTCGWLVYCLVEAGLGPNFIIGGDIPQLGGSCGVGAGGHFVAEACEYDRSFLSLRPEIGAILNIEPDHLDYYEDEEDIVQAFSHFAGGIRPGGVLVANGQDRNVVKVIDNCGLRINDNLLRCETFGLDTNCNYRAQNLRISDGLYGFDVFYNTELLGPADISLPGRHNVLNALAVVAIGVNMGLEPQQVLGLLPGFAGVDRRLTLKGRFGEVTVIDDYAHHPTEIKASLEAIRQRYRPQRLWCVFQPHQYSRTRFFLDDFAESFKLADVTVVPEIYFVRDSAQSKNKVNSQMLAERIRANGTEAVSIDSFGEVCDYLETSVAAGDVVVTMGAGDVWKIADEYIQRLRQYC
ncbi:MAG: UDP-N-acetylmuramate--L-alanine ligase [Planctomycetota bacterium]